MNNAMACKILKDCLEKAKGFKEIVYLSDNDKESLENIVLGSHLTFRYILLTAVTAKCVDKSIHMRSLQAQAPLSGAYDARSLCHTVLVPFERTNLGLRLGGSNEPFLNKPARFVAVEKENPVRAGSDRRLLHKLFDILELLNDAESAKIEEALVYCLFLTLKREPRLSSFVNVLTIDYTQHQAQAIIDDILLYCGGGESAVAVTTAILRTFLKDIFFVKVSPANQAGTSSRGVGDIDILKDNIVLCAVEVKDKPFSNFDVEHAVRIAKVSMVNRLIFVIGTAVPDSCIPNLPLLENNARLDGFDLSFLYIKQFAYSMLGYFNSSQRKEMLYEIAVVMDEMRASDATKNYARAIFENFKLSNEKLSTTTQGDGFSDL